MSYHNEHTHFCREMCNFVNTRFLRPYGVITEITTKSPQKLYNGSSFSPHFTQKSSFYPLESFWPRTPQNKIPFMEAMYLFFTLKHRCKILNDILHSSPVLTYILSVTVVLLTSWVPVLSPHARCCKGSEKERLDIVCIALKMW